MLYFRPNRIPRAERIFYIITSLVLLTYGTYGLIHHNIYLPGKSSSGVQFKGKSTIIVYIALLCAVLNMISVVIDHYDRRNNEIKYEIFAKITQILGWALFILAGIVNIIFV